jgi:hypothetical protein
MNDNLPLEIKWRGATYVMLSVQDGYVTWRNTFSGYSESCSVESWKEGKPYERQMGAY